MSHTMKAMLHTLEQTEMAIAQEFDLDELWHGLVDCTNDNFVFSICTDDVKDVEQVLEQIREVSYQFDTIDDLNDGDCYAIEVYGTSVWLSKDKQYCLVVGSQNNLDMNFYLFDMKNNRNNEWTDE
ncbi:hypothetical protein MYOV011v1_p0006 [Vibrio phage 6E35.1a]|nr:hypothetical protein MYOV011v1_p0006 [Vibrio phage 6E35.1a]